MSPIPVRNPSEMVARMPASAVTDMMEWGPAATPEDQFQRVLSRQMTLDQLIDGAPNTPAMKDDRPINEYFLLRSDSRPQSPQPLPTDTRRRVPRFRGESSLPLNASSK